MDCTVPGGEGAGTYAVTRVALAKFASVIGDVEYLTSYCIAVPTLVPLSAVAVHWMAIEVA
jgi:hypothetical protein